MKRQNTVGYLFWAIIFLLWIGFLFFDAKKVALPDFTIPFEQVSSWEVQEKKSETPEYTDFLTRDKQVSLDNLETLGTIKEKIQLLEHIFQQKQDKQVSQLLITSYLLDNQFDKAKKLYLSLSPEVQSQLPVDTVFKIWINAFSQTSEKEYQQTKALLEQLYQQKVFSELDRKYYATVFALVEHRYDDAKSSLKALTNTKYQEFSMAISSAFKQYESLKDVPDYYLDWLVAYQLMNQGFLAPAKKIALKITTQHSDYILPQQILANIDFMMGRWSSAASYFSQLLKLDYQEKNLYLYHLGVCYYQLGKYDDAILYLAQISDNSILLDSDRYLILSYIALGEQNKVFAGRQRLLGYPSIKKSDFYSFFEEALWKPYRLGETSPYLQKNWKLVEAYLSSCKKKLIWEDLQICSYGDLGLKVQQGELSDPDLEVQINRFARKTPKSEFFQLLWELALKSWDKEKATTTLMKAIGLTNKQKERTYLKKLILQANNVEE